MTEAFFVDVRIVLGGLQLVDLNSQNCATTDFCVNKHIFPCRQAKSYLGIDLHLTY